jgi:hypothetical protein
LTYARKVAIILSMIENDISYGIFVVMCVGIAWTLGKQFGIQTTIDYLEKEGLLEFDDSEK